MDMSTTGVTKRATRFARFADRTRFGSQNGGACTSRSQIAAACGHVGQQEATRLHKPLPCVHCPKS